LKKALAILGAVFLLSNAGPLAGGPVTNWAEYVYTVCGKDGRMPVIECSTHADKNGPSIFNPNQSKNHVFSGTPAKWLDAA
jgi:hypothetical protein